MPRGDPRETQWLRENYAHGTIHDTLDAFEAEFGRRPSPRTIYVKAHRLGLHKELQDSRVRTGTAQRRVVWSKEPELTAWMLEHDTGGHQQTIEAFEREFGFRLSRGQVNIFRASHGTQRKKSAGGRPRRSVGYERETKGGILVKVAEEATVPMSKDNWRLKHVIAYEEAYGPVPDGCVVYSVDGDKANCDPANLAAVPRRWVFALNQAKPDGGWQSRDALLASAALVGMGVAVNDAESRVGCTCGVCGRRFTPGDGWREHGGPLPQTCPDCVAAGRRAKGHRRARSGPAVRTCSVCGTEFEPETSRQRRCARCIAEKPRHSAKAQRRSRT